MRNDKKTVFLLWIWLLKNASASISVNLKPPQFLRNLLLQDKPTETTSTETQKQQPNLLRLDLSGKMETLLVGPSESSESSVMKPLVSGPISVSVGSYFDFAQHWYGATRLFGRLGIFLPQSNSLVSKLLPSTMQVTAEQSLPSSGTAVLRSNTFCVSWGGTNDNDDDNLVASMRLSNTNQKTLSLSIPLHKRVRWEYRATNVVTQSSTARSSEIPNHQQDPWWLPAVSVNAMGSMQSENSLQLQKQQATVKLFLRRNLATSWLDHSDATTTRVALQVRDEKSASTAQLEGVLEHLKETLCLTVIQQAPIRPLF